MQVISLILLGWSLIGLIRPAESLVLLNLAGPEGTFLGIFLVLFCLCRFSSLHMRIPLLLALGCSLAGVYQTVVSAGIPDWLMLMIAAGGAVFLAAEHLILRFWQQRFFWPLFLLNGSFLIWFYLDRMFYTVSKTHLSLNHLLQIALIYDDLIEALHFAGKGYLMLLVEAFVFIFAVVPAALIIGRVAKKPSVKGATDSFGVLLVAICVFLLSAWRFDVACAGLPVYEYLPLRLDLGVLPVPDHPELRRSANLKGLLSQKISLDEDKIYPQNSFALKTGNKIPNLVMISVESLRRQEFNTIMPLTKAFAGRGLFLSQHQSISNISLSSFHSIFRSSFPLNLPFSRHETEKIPFQQYLETLGLKSCLVGSSNYQMQRSSFWEGNLCQAQVEKHWQSSPAVLDKLSELLRKPEKLAVHAYLYNLHFNYYYPPEAEHYKPVISEDINLFLMQPEGENLQGLANRYANAAIYTDTVLADFLARAEAAGRFADTLFVIFGDHGESLGESGFITHATGPHRKQFEIPAFLLGAGIKPQVVTTPTTHADLLPIICETMGIEVKNTFGSGLALEGSFPLLQLDESVTGRIIVRHRDFMSIFDLAGHRQLKWLATLSNDFAIDASVARLYVADSFSELAEVIKADADFIKSRIGKAFE
ncbi:MAG: sulfatase-like hydrolase/transferase [Candidatus Riflebacteria bacterium]|nr:sulfatase-like hydrolase/transferase [Candidatus Riflebacteria bacterium]